MRFILIHFLLFTARVAAADLHPLINIANTAGNAVATLATDMPWNEYNGFCTEETCSGDPHDYFLLAIDESTRNITRSAKDFGYSLAANSPIDDQTAQVPTSLAWSVPINFVPINFSTRSFRL